MRAWIGGLRAVCPLYTCSFMCWLARGERYRFNLTISPQLLPQLGNNLYVNVGRFLRVRAGCAGYRGLQGSVFDSASAKRRYRSAR